MDYGFSKPVAVPLVSPEAVKNMFMEPNRAKRFVCVGVFRAIWGIVDQGPCCEICWKSFISPVSPIVEQDCGCHKCLNGLNLQRNGRVRERECEKTPKFEVFFS